MFLYHFTSSGSLPTILEEGLSIGDVPLFQDAPIHSCNAVNFTTLPVPQGTGIDSGAVRVSELPPDEQAYIARVHGVDHLPNGAILPDKTAVRIRVDFPHTLSKKLVPWSKFVRKRGMKPSWRAALEKGNRPDTWWLYFAV